MAVHSVLHSSDAVTLRADPHLHHMIYIVSLGTRQAANYGKGLTKKELTLLYSFIAGEAYKNIQNRINWRHFGLWSDKDKIIFKNVTECNLWHERKKKLTVN